MTWARSRSATRTLFLIYHVAGIFTLALLADNIPVPNTHQY